MHSPLQALVNSTRATVLGKPAARSQQEEKELARFMETACGQGQCLQLRPQQRVPIPPAEKVVVLREGMLAIDAMPEKGKLQILDFLVAGDVVSASIVLPTPRVSLRAITNVSLVSLDPPAINRALPAHDYWAFLIAQCLNQISRVNIHQLMTGRLTTEPRVASFLLALALRNVHEPAPELTVLLPMSRTDIANYLVINCDTLSRTMMRFSDLGLIEREGRHAIRIIDLEALKEKSPLAPLLSVVFEKGNRRQWVFFANDAERGASILDGCRQAGNEDVWYSSFRGEKPATPRHKQF
jgi:CRP/FNR family transcriptional regulator